MTPRAPILVLGLGNELFTDEGIGVEAARRLAESELPGVEIMDGGTLGITLLPELEGRDAVLILDAVAAEGEAPGAVIVMDNADLALPFRLLFSAHQIGVSETLAAARLVGTAPSRIVAVGMVPFSLDPGFGISSEAQPIVDEMVETAHQILTAWQEELAYA